ncbi:Protein ClpV1 [BD1-7 clade bacterium]|uniref:Protein ClpV1 n=1 Tax=BD1-7 clade bacterium TaxID=2029982 RepID=A0A5S9QXN2_9GAMM|nr:Protein ClpV1 [BD1-7 clade bacterium]
MISIKRSHLFSKLNPTCLKAIESATVSTKLHNHTRVTLAHWLLLLVDGDNRLHAMLVKQDAALPRIKADLQNTISAIPQQEGESLDFDDNVEHLIHQAWIQASLVCNQNSIDSLHLLLALLSDNHLRQSLKKLSPALASLDYHQTMSLQTSLPTTAEKTDARPKNASPDFDTANTQPALETFTTDLTAKARAGKLDAVIGREDEIDQMLDVLLRRRQNNPLLLGEAGVGKTAIAEGFALKVANGEVPPPLQNIQVRVLDLVVLQAGASMKGEFEQRLHDVIEQAIGSEIPIILFIDEAHTLIGAGGEQGTGDAANLLKPALARGELKVIAATTWAEYKKYLEKDQALARRFQSIQVAEPDTEKAVRILTAVADLLANHHGVVITDEAIDAAVKLSQRYIGWRQLPDKAISLLDTACAQVAGSRYKTPRVIQHLQQDILANQNRQRRKKQCGTVAVNDIDALKQTQANLNSTTQTWRQARKLVEEIDQHNQTLFSQITSEANALEDDFQTDTEDSFYAKRQAKAALDALQQDNPMIHDEVDSAAIARVVEDWTGIPVTRQSTDELQTCLQLDQSLQQHVIGQKTALNALCERVKIAKASLTDPNKPTGVFLLAGPSGTGKTETALALAELLYGSRDSLITLNMSEYQESHSVSKLKGAPPGYVGYGSGGILTEAVRKKPFSLVLLDEIEKAHPDIYELFFQVFDKGTLEDSEGRKVDFRNTLIILTSNAASDTVVDLSQTQLDSETQYQRLHETLLETFPPAFLGRVTPLIFHPLTHEQLTQITQLQLRRIAQRLSDNHQILLNFDDSVLTYIANRCQSTDTGARLIDHLLNRQLLPVISRRIIESMVDNHPLAQIDVRINKDQWDCQYHAIRGDQEVANYEPTHQSGNGALSRVPNGLFSGDYSSPQ